MTDSQATEQVSLPRALLDGTLARLVGRFGLTEVPGPDGGALVPLVSTMGPVPAPVGALRAFTGRPEGVVDQVVTISLAVPFIGLDSHMLFAFTRPDSAVPHFTVDAVFAGGSHAFHLDLIPRVDLGANLGYIDSVYAPLTEAWEAARALAGTTPAKLGPRQLAIMSPWLLAFRADAEAFARLSAPVDAYLEHWAGLCERGLPAPVARGLHGAEPATLAARDQRNKDAIFNPEVDPVWAQVDRLIGPVVGARLREILRTGRA